MKNERQVLQDIVNMRMAKKPLREIADIYGGKITHGDIGRILEGVFPMGEEKRAALGLPPKCRVCYQVIHVPRAEIQQRITAPWLIQAAGALAAIERPAKDPVRLYTRGGKRANR